VSAEEELNRANEYALMLVTHLAKRFGAVPAWRPLPDLLGKLTQIDNLTAGMRSRAESEASAQKKEKEKTS
jgi:hypothetical protein